MASSSLKTGYGNIDIKWERKNEDIYLNLKVPANTQALLRIPKTLGEDLKKITWGNQNNFSFL
ncbi:MAG: hypothetical protein HC906_03730 [Bacteroidales bacterium]|nr:hypothetical protein [Bacteroidales bacterium]